MNSINTTDLTLENIGQWPKIAKFGVFLGLGILMAILGYWLVIEDNWEQLKRLQTEEFFLKTDFANKQPQVANLELWRKQLQTLDGHFKLMLQKLPVKNEMPGLLENISQTGVISGLKFELFAPQPEVVHDFYVESPIKISVTGTYFQIAHFLSRITQMNRIVTFEEFTVASSRAKGQLVMNLTAKIYRYKTS